MIRLKILALLCSLIFSLNLFSDDDYEKEKFKEYKERFYNSSKHHLYKNLDYLHLNKQQYHTLKNILLEYKKEYKQFNKFKREKEKELANILKEEIFDEKKYKNIFNEIESKTLEIELNNFKKIHTILNEKQREKFSYYMQEWRVE